MLKEFTKYTSNLLYFLKELIIMRKTVLTCSDISNETFDETCLFFLMSSLNSKTHLNLQQSHLLKNDNFLVEFLSSTEVHIWFLLAIKLTNRIQH